MSMGSAAASDGPGDGRRELPGGRSTGETLNLVIESIVAEGVAELSRPHVLIIVECGVVHVSGPYHDGQAALCALEDDRRANVDIPADQRFYRLAPLLPAYCAHLLDRTGAEPDRRRID